MRNDPTVIHSYSDAMMSIAKKKNIVNELFDEALAFIKLKDISRKLVVFLEGPHIEDAEKHHLIDVVFNGRMSEYLVNLLHILIENHRAEYLRDILKDFIRKIQLFKNIYPATIITAHQISNLDSMALKTALEKFTGKHLEIKYVQKKEIIGGLIFKFGDMHVDYSLRDSLNEIKKELEKVALP